MCHSLTGDCHSDGPADRPAHPAGPDGGGVPTLCPCLHPAGRWRHASLPGHVLPAADGDTAPAGGWTLLPVLQIPHLLHYINITCRRSVVLTLLCILDVLHYLKIT